MTVVTVCLRCTKGGGLTEGKCVNGTFCNKVTVYVAKHNKFLVASEHTQVHQQYYQEKNNIFMVLFWLTEWPCLCHELWWWNCVRMQVGVWLCMHGGEQRLQLTCGCWEDFSVASYQKVQLWFLETISLTSWPAFDWQIAESVVGNMKSVCQ